MSRNFELLAQLEAEQDSKADHELLIRPVAANDKTLTHSDDGHQEEVLRLVQRAFLSAIGAAPRQVVFCGVDGGNGSTSVCASAARALATSISKTVCVIDANLKAACLSHLLGVGDMLPIFGGRAPMREGCFQIGSNLWFGGPDVVADKTCTLASTDQLKERLARLRNVFDFVMIDVPGLDVSEDGAMFGRLADAVILVIDANRTRRLAARKAFETLEAAGAKLLGTVLRNRSFPIPKKLYNRL